MLFVSASNLSNCRDISVCSNKDSSSACSLQQDGHKAAHMTWAIPPRWSKCLTCLFKLLPHTGFEVWRTSCDKFTRQRHESSLFIGLWDSFLLQSNLVSVLSIKSSKHEILLHPWWGSILPCISDSTSHLQPSVPPSRSPSTCMADWRASSIHGQLHPGWPKMGQELQDLLRSEESCRINIQSAVWRVCDGEWTCKWGIYKM